MDGMEAGAQGSQCLCAPHTAAQHTGGAATMSLMGDTSRKVPTCWKGDIANSWQLLCVSKLQKTEASMTRIPVLGEHFVKKLLKLH